MANIDTTAQVIAGLEKGIEAGEFVRFDPEAGEEQLDLDTVDLDADVEQAPASVNTASEKQIALIKKLSTERDADEVVEHGRELWREGRLSGGRDGEASKLITALFAAPRRVTERAEVPEGMHLMAGRVFKVQRAVHGSGNLYAKELTETEPGDWTFDYAPGAVRLLNEQTLMTLEQAEQFGRLYGTCAVCGRTLTNEKSIAAGIGPICAGRF